MVQDAFNLMTECLSHLRLALDLRQNLAKMTCKRL